jgi:hypothetical protein
MGTLAASKNVWSRIVGPPKKIFGDLAARGNRMAFISLIGMTIALFASGVAYMLYGDSAGIIVSVVMIFATAFVAMWSMFYGSTRIMPSDADIAMANLMVTWIGLSHSERARRLEQLQKSDVDIDDRMLRILESEHRDLEEMHGDC